MKAVELERTFLVVAPPSEINGVEPVQILDVYIPEGAAHSHLRLRRKGERYFITKKSTCGG